MNLVKIGMTDWCFMTLKSEIKTTNFPNLQNFEIEQANIIDFKKILKF